MAFNSEGFDNATPLPPRLKIGHIRKAIDHIESEASEYLDIYYAQANVFSALVGIFCVRALHSLSPYKKQA